MDLFTYLMAKNGNNSAVHGDLFSYLLGKGQSQTYTVSGTTIYIPDAKKFVSFMMTKESTQATSILPSGYTQVDYIESSGTQYIDTGISVNDNINFELKFKSIGNGGIFGRFVSTSERLALQASSFLAFGYGSELIYLYDDSSYKNQILNLELNNKKLYLNGELKNTLTSTLINSTNIILFGIREANLSSCDIYYCKIYNGNTLVREFIPCYRNSDNEVGLYDLVNDVFYTNSGTGSFTYGSVAQLPNPDYPVEVKTVKGSVDVYVSNGETTNTYTINLGNNELVGIGDYKDELLVDKSGNVFINKKMSKLILNGSETWTKSQYSNETYSVFICNDYNSILPILPNGAFKFSNYFETYKNTGQSIPNRQSIGYSARNYGIRCAIYKSIADTVEDFKTWLSTHNTEVYYVLETPELIDLQTTVDLKLFKGVNNIINSEDGYMTIEYR